MPIPGTTKLSRLEENIGAAAVELTPDDLSEIQAAASKIEIQGLSKATHNRETGRYVASGAGWAAKLTVLGQFRATPRT